MANYRRRRASSWRMIAVAVAAIFVVVSIAAVLIVNTFLDKIDNNPEGFVETIPEVYDVPTESLVHEIPKEEGITNILLLGVDNRNSTVASPEERSDSMIILTIDEKSKKFKLTSLQRDMMVYFPGADNIHKINSANAEGGPLLAMRVINDTFRLNIEKYVLVNMIGMEKIIDLVGGVPVEVSESELKALNAELTMINLTFKNTKPAAYLEKTGSQLLDGRQAVTYARIRQNDDDYHRMGRQREVLQAMLDQFMKADLATKTKALNEGLPLITTNITKDEIIKLGIDLLPMMDATIDQMQIPTAGDFREYSGTIWMNLCDYNAMVPKLQQFMFGKTYAFDKVREIPGAPNSSISLPSSYEKKILETAKPDESVDPALTSSSDATATSETKAG
ncbi:MAG: LytR family transcriptional regulator [Clostridia bacterium]|nr:LytR family transcriptional regulator [Clostridia bacterium]